MAALAVVGLLLFAGAGVAHRLGVQDLTAAGSHVSLVNTISVAKTPFGRLAKTDPALLGRTDSRPVNVMIKYDSTRPRRTRAASRASRRRARA